MQHYNVIRLPDRIVGRLRAQIREVLLRVDRQRGDLIAVAKSEGELVGAIIGRKDPDPGGNRDQGEGAHSRTLTPAKAEAPGSPKPETS